MGFKDVKSKALKCLSNGQVLHEERDNIDIKNLLSSGVISLHDVAQIIGRSRGYDYSSGSHHFDDKITVHVIKTTCFGQSWYIKWYFVEPDSVFISVHH